MTWMEKQVNDREMKLPSQFSSLILKSKYLIVDYSLMWCGSHSKRQYAGMCDFWSMCLWATSHLLIHFDGMWSCEGRVNTPVVPTSHPRYALHSFAVQDRPPHRNVRKDFTA